MKFIRFIFFVSVFLFSGILSFATDVERWARFEISLPGPQSGNPFSDVSLSAEFTNGSEKMKAEGFYDGNGIFKIRFMPQKEGEWKYKTISDVKILNGKSGSFNCVPASGNNHGPVTVAEVYNFKYADGKRYYPFGTTLYAWTHQPEGLEEMTLKTLEKAPFNKVRMCVFPKFYSNVENEPERWGRLSGEEMTEAFWQGVIAGTYVTHGETYKNKGDTIFWAKGGRLIGSSPARIGFLRKLLEEGPGPLQLADPWKDHKTAMADSSYYLVYFGKEMSSEWTFNLPKKNGPTANRKFTVKLIDTWNMTITKIPDVFETSEPVEYRIYDKNRKAIRLPMKPYLALRIREVS